MSEVLETKEEGNEAHVQAILLGSEQEAQGVKARLKAGEDFATLAEEFSQLDYSKGDAGDLGWVTPDTVSSAFGDFVFNSEVELETISEPVRDETITTKGGYWLLKILDKEDDRGISDDDRDLLAAVALDEWVSSLWSDPQNDIESYLDSAKRKLAVDKAMGG